MSIFTEQMAAAYYERFKNNELMFSREMILATGLIPEQVQLKCDIDFWPCILYAASFQGAKVLVPGKSDLLPRLESGFSHVNIRFAFRGDDEKKAVAFFVGANVSETAPYKSNEDYTLITLRFPHHPPNHYMEIMGRVMDADENFAKHKDEKILLTAEARRRLRISARETTVFIQRVPRRCLLRELSFSGAKLAMTGVAKFLLDREAALRVEFDDPKDAILVKGKFTLSENVEGKKELLILSMDFDEAQVPINYKARINDYLKIHHLYKHSAPAPSAVEIPDLGPQSGENIEMDTAS